MTVSSIISAAARATPRGVSNYVAYAIECRRRVKEQMNKRKPDDEFAKIDLSFFNKDGKEIVVSCLESIGASATLEPVRRRLRPKIVEATPANEPSSTSVPQAAPPAMAALPPETEEPTEQHYTIAYGDTGHSYDTIFGPYLPGAKSVVVEDPYIRMPHQIANFVRFCETAVKAETVRSITLFTSYDQQTDLAGLQEKLAGCGKSSKFEGFPEVLRTPPCVRGLILLHPLALTARIGNCSPPSCSHPAGMTACPARAARRAARAVMPCRRPVAITVAAAA